MQEEMGNCLYVYGLAKIGEGSKWKDAGIDNKQVFIISEGKIGALVHSCKAEPYAPGDPEKAKELVLVHNTILENAIKIFGGVIPSSFNTIILEKEGKSAEENLRNWLKENAKKNEQVWERVKGKKEYGIRIFYDRKKWIEEIKSQSKSIDETNKGMSYLLKKKQEYEIKDKVISRMKEGKKEIFNEIRTKVKEAKIVQPNINLIEEKRDILINISILATEQQFVEVRQHLQKNIGEYRCAGPFPPYSFVE